MEIVPSELKALTSRLVDSSLSFGLIRFGGDRHYSSRVGAQRLDTLPPDPRRHEDVRLSRESNYVP